MDGFCGQVYTNHPADHQALGEWYRAFEHTQAAS
jgi:hypothetical protein